MSIGSMSHLDFKKLPCRPVEFKGQGPYSCSEMLVAGWELMDEALTSRKRYQIPTKVSTQTTPGLHGYTPKTGGAPMYRRRADMRDHY